MKPANHTTDFEIDPATVIGKVALNVRDLDRSTHFYRERIGFQVHEQSERTAILGAGQEALLHLTADPDAAASSPRTTGLYHFAILVPDRWHLAQALRRLAETQTPVQGFADHLVSEAIYLADPDGNGIEIYRDRPREAWPRSADGRIKMATDPLDVEGIMSELTRTPERIAHLDPDTVIGHIHLRVANLAETEHFYRDLLGFELILRYGSAASFFGAGGYHHHIGTNTWASAGAPPPPPGATGLRWFEVRLPDSTSLEELRRRFDQAGHAHTEQPEGLLLQDPAGNGILLTANA